MVQAVAHLPAVDFKRPAGAVTPVGPELTNGAIGDDTPSPADAKKDKDAKDALKIKTMQRRNLRK
jgi:hypothetical protein